MATILKIDNLGKTYQSAGRELTVLENINFSVEAGSTMAIVGPSGSGKTTLLGLAAGLDRSTTGSVELNNIKLDQLNEDQRASIRNQHVGFIFQSFQLLPTLAAQQMLTNLFAPGHLSTYLRSQNLHFQFLYYHQPLHHIATSSFDPPMQLVRF